MKIRRAACVALLALALAGAGCGHNATPSTSSGSGGTLTASPASFSVGINQFPAGIGTRLVMSFSDYSDNTRTRAWDVQTRVEGHDGDLVTYVDDMNGAKTRYFAVTRPDAIYMCLEEPPLEKGTAQHSVQHASKMFVFPLEPGRAWDYTTPRGGPAHREVEGEETIRVPAGKFKAVRILDKREGAVGRIWFAPGVGVIKSDINSTDGRHTKELKAFVAASH